MPCTAPSIPLLEAFRPLFTAPTWKKMLTLLRGTLLARGPRTVTAALWHTGHEQDPHFSAFIRSSTAPAGHRCRQVDACSRSSSRPLSKLEAAWIS